MRHSGIPAASENWAVVEKWRSHDFMIKVSWFDDRGYKI